MTSKTHVLRPGFAGSVLMTSDVRRASREDDARARAVMHDFRGELARLAVFFDPDDGTDAAFRALVRAQLAEHASPEAVAGIRLRAWTPPTLPAQPYPVLHSPRPQILTPAP